MALVMECMNLLRKVLWFLWIALQAWFYTFRALSQKDEEILSFFFWRDKFLTSFFVYQASFQCGTMVKEFFMFLLGAWNLDGQNQSVVLTVEQSLARYFYSLDDFSILQLMLRGATKLKARLVSFPSLPSSSISKYLISPSRVKAFIFCFNVFTSCLNFKHSKTLFSLIILISLFYMERVKLRLLVCLSCFSWVFTSYRNYKACVLKVLSYAFKESQQASFLTSASIFLKDSLAKMSSFDILSKMRAKARTK